MSFPSEKQTVLLLDDSPDYAEGKMYFKIIESCLKRKVSESLHVTSCTTIEEWQKAFRSFGKPEVVIHDWDLSNFGPHAPFETLDSILLFLKKSIPVVVYTANEVQTLLGDIHLLLSQESLTTKMGKYGKDDLSLLHSLYYVQKGNLAGLIDVMKTLREGTHTVLQQIIS